MRTIKTTTGVAVALDNDLLAVLETLFQEVTVKKGDFIVQRGTNGQSLIPRCDEASGVDALFPLFFLLEELRLQGKSAAEYQSAVPPPIDEPIRMRRSWPRARRKSCTRRTSCACGPGWRWGGTGCATAWRIT